MSHFINSMPNTIMLSVAILSVVMLSALMLTVMAPKRPRSRAWTKNLFTIVIKLPSLTFVCLHLGSTLVSFSGVEVVSDKGTSLPSRNNQCEKYCTTVSRA